MADIAVSGSKYTMKEREAAAIEYATLGNMAKVSKNLNIPETTLSSWKRESDWWDGLVAEVRSAKTEEIRARYIDMVTASQAQVMDKLPEATAQQAATVGAIAFDKVRLIDNAPTRITSGTADMLALAKQFQEITHQLRNERVVAVQEKEPQGEDG